MGRGVCKTVILPLHKGVCGGKLLSILNEGRGAQFWGSFSKGAWKHVAILKGGGGLQQKSAIQKGGRLS